MLSYLLGVFYLLVLICVFLYVLVLSWALAPIIHREGVKKLKKKIDFCIFGPNLL